MTKPTFKRADRVSDQMKQEIADILMRKIKDPRIGFVTITDVEVTDDLKNAKVFVSIYDGDKETTLKGLKSASPFIRAELGRRMRLSLCRKSCSGSTVQWRRVPISWSSCGR